MKIVNISAYKFVDIAHPEQLRVTLEARCGQYGLKGTILLGHEGINLMLAGGRSGIDQWVSDLKSDACFADIDIKESYSSFIPFTRLKIKIKDEIIAMRMDNVNPTKHTAPHLSPEDFRQKLTEGCVFLDTRNNFEVEAGTFKNAINPDIMCFREFPDALKKLDPKLKKQPVLIACTGGIRCEKAAVAMYNEGFKEVYQLDGGIINYFEHCGGDYYEGNCVVFDDRIALTPQLEPINL